MDDLEILPLFNSKSFIINYLTTTPWVNIKAEISTEIYLIFSNVCAHKGTRQVGSLVTTQPRSTSESERRTIPGRQAADHRSRNSVPFNAMLGVV
jgi:hypothetical protein